MVTATAKCPCASADRSTVAEAPTNPARITSFPCMSKIRTVFAPATSAVTARCRPSSDRAKRGSTCVPAANIADEGGTSALLEDSACEELDCEEDETDEDEAGGRTPHSLTSTEASRVKQASVSPDFTKLNTPGIGDLEPALYTSGEYESFAHGNPFTSEVLISTRLKSSIPLTLFISQACAS